MGKLPTACLHLKVVARALGAKDLPTNTIHRVLEGFGKSYTTSFNEFCTSQIAMQCGSFYDKLMHSSSLQTQLNDVLNDLKATYLDLVGGKLWVGNTASPTKATFCCGLQPRRGNRQGKGIGTQEKASI